MNAQEQKHPFMSTPSTLPVASTGETVEAPPQLPIGDRGYYACRTCRRILTEPQWYSQGCLHCGTGPVARGELTEYATTHFSNFIGLIDPQRSWVARLIQKNQTESNAVFAEALSDEDDDMGDADDESLAEEDEDDVDDNQDQEKATTERDAVPPAPRPMTDDELLGLF